MFKFQNNLIPTAIANHFEQNTVPERLYKFRNRPNLHITNIKYYTKYGKVSLQERGVELWKKVPSIIQSSETPYIFKSAFKKHLLVGGTNGA